MGCPYLGDCSKQKWIANEKSFKNPRKQAVCPFPSGNPNETYPYLVISVKNAKCKLTVKHLCFAVFNFS